MARMKGRSQLQYFYDSHRHIADRHEHVMELINHPTNPLTNKDLAALIERFPQRWKRFEGFLGKLKD